GRPRGCRSLRKDGRVSRRKDRRRSDPRRDLEPETSGSGRGDGADCAFSRYLVRGWAMTHPSSLIPCTIRDSKSEETTMSGNLIDYRVEKGVAIFELN